MSTITTMQALFSVVPVSGTVRRHWAAQNKAALDSAASKLEAHGANPWAFSADERHYEMVAGAAEKAAMASLSMEEAQALLTW